MPKKLSPQHAKIASLLHSWGYTLDEAQIVELALAAKPERKAPAVKRDDSEVREVVAEFCKASGVREPNGLWTKPSQNECVMWIAPTKRIIFQCNSKSKIAIVEAVKALRASQLTCATPMSAEKLAISWHAKQSADPTPQLFKDY